MMLVTLQEAKDHIRIDTDDEDDDLTLKIQAASEAVVDYIKEADFITDGVVTGAVPFRVKAAVLLMTRILYRDDQEQGEWDHGYLPKPVIALVYSMRKLTCA